MQSLKVQLLQGISALTDIIYSLAGVLRFCEVAVIKIIMKNFSSGAIKMT